MNTRILLMLLASTISVIGSVLGVWWFLIQPSRYKRRPQKKGTKQVVLVTTLIITGALTLLATLSGDLQSSQLFTYAGLVTDDENRPIQGARVTVEGSGLPVTAVTDSDGAFVARGLAPGTGMVRISITAPGYERLDEYVLPSQTGMRRFLLKRTLTNDCPNIIIKCPPETTRGNLIEFHATILGNSNGASLTYNWIISAGKIVRGQGTSSITVDTTNLIDQTVTATVEIGGLDPACSKAASCSTQVNK